MKLNVLRAAKARAEAGDWVGEIPGCGDLRLHVRGIGNRDHLRIVREALPPPDAPELTEEQRIAVTADVISGALLIGWENLTGDDDEPVPYTPEVAGRIVRSHDFEAFRGAVLWAAAQVSKARPGDSVRDVIEAAE